MAAASVASSRCARLSASSAEASPAARAAPCDASAAGHSPASASRYASTPALTSASSPGSAGRPTSRANSPARRTAAFSSSCRCPHTVTAWACCSRSSPRRRRSAAATVWASRTAASGGTARCSSASRSRRPSSVGQRRVELADRRPLLPQLLGEPRDPGPPCGLTRPLADVAGAVLPPGTAQHAVRPAAVGGYPRPLCPAKPDGRKNGADRLSRQQPRLGIVRVDRRDQDTRARRAGYGREPGHHGHIAVDEVPVGRDPGVEYPGRLQRGLEPGAMLLRHVRREIGHLPQRRTRTVVPDAGLPRMRKRRSVVAARSQPLDLSPEFVRATPRERHAERTVRRRDGRARRLPPGPRRRWRRPPDWRRPRSPPTLPGRRSARPDQRS